MNNFIGIEPHNHDREIYRVMSINRLISMLENDENTLVRPELWDDPFENFILNIPINNPNGGTSLTPLRKRAYGQNSNI